MGTNFVRSAGAVDETASYDLPALYRLLRRYAWLIIACVLLGGGLAAAYLVYTPKIYAATSVVQVEPQEAAVLNIQNVGKEDLGASEGLRTIEQSLSNREVILRVIEQCGLEKLPGFFPTKHGKPMPREEMVSSFRDHLTVKLRKGTRLIDLTLEDADPKLALRLLNTLLDEFINQSMTQKLELSKDANRFLGEEVTRLKQRLDSAEQAMQAYMEENQAVSLEERQDIVTERLKDLSLRVSKAENDRLTLESGVAQIEKSAGNPRELLGIQSIASAESVLSVQQLATLRESEFAILKHRYLPEHPKYIQAEQQLREIKEALNAAVLHAAEFVKATFESAVATEKKLRENLRETENLALELNRKAIRYGVLHREAESDAALYDAVLKRLKETGVMEGVNSSSLRILEPGLLPETPVRPKKKQALALGLFAGLMLGGISSLGLHAVRDTFSTPAEAERALHCPALGTVPHLARLKLGPAGIGLMDEGRSPAAEAFRALQTSVSIFSAREPRSILFTSAAAHDGKSTCAFLYAVLCAQSSMRTLLVDADFQDASLSRSFEVKRSGPGVGGYLHGSATFESTIREAGTANLFVAGSDAPVGTGTAEQRTVADFLQEAGQRFEVVVVDSSGLNGVSEALLWVKHVEAVCLVVRSGKTSMTAAKRACGLLTRVNATPLGFVFNDAKM